MDATSSHPFWTLYSETFPATRCEWDTQFGPPKLNLNGIASAQARLMARATCGAERLEWNAAAHWLEQLERELNDAHSQARQAALLAEDGNWQEAMLCIDHAVERDERYHCPSAWRELQAAIHRRAPCIESEFSI